MPRIKELVRIATLERHFHEELVESVEVIVDEERWILCVHYNEKAEGPKTRYLTSKRVAGAKRFASFSTVWKLVEACGVENVVVRKATPEETEYLRN